MLIASPHYHGVYKESNAFGAGVAIEQHKRNKEGGNDCLQILEMKLVDIKMELAKRIGKEDKMDQMPRN